MKTSKLTVVLRSLLGLMFVAGPFATALHLAPDPPLPTGAAAFIAALAGTGYMLPLLWSTEIAAGLLLLTGLLPPLGLLLLAPVIVNIAGFHVFLAPAASAPAVAACALEVVLAWQYRAVFAPLFQTAGTWRASESTEVEMRSGLNAKRELIVR